MNIELSTGLEFFWQWDANLKLKVPDEIPEVHFRFGNKSKAYEVKDGWVSVPNELLQKPDDIECWFYDTEHTMDFGRIEGRRRPKPDGYVYEETEFKSWTELDEKITKALEELEKTNNEVSSLGEKLDETKYTNNLGYIWTGTDGITKASYYDQIAYVKINQKISDSALESVNDIPLYKFYI